MVPSRQDATGAPSADLSAEGLSPTVAILMFVLGLTALIAVRARLTVNRCVRRNPMSLTLCPYRCITPATLGHPEASRICWTPPSCAYSYVCV